MVEVSNSSVYREKERFVVTMVLVFSQRSEITLNNSSD